MSVVMEESVQILDGMGHGGRFGSGLVEIRFDRVHGGPGEDPGIGRHEAGHVVRQQEGFEEVGRDRLPVGLPRPGR